MNQSRKLHLLALNRVPFLNTREKLYFVEILEDLRSFFSLSRKQIEAAVARRLRTDDLALSDQLRAAAADLDFLERNANTGFLYYWDPGYPAGLREIYDPPLLLFYRGRLPSFEEPVVAIVGTRMPTGKARSAAYRLAMELADRGIGIVSGLARGIDAEAHQGSLPGRGVSLAVLGNGIDAFYPLSNRKLGYDLLASGGVIFSEFPPGTPPLRYNFPKRNRIISGMARSVVIIQAPEKSGALITADYALGQGRDIYVHKAGISGEVGRGTCKLAEDGALLIENSSHLFYDWGWMDGGFPLSSQAIKTEWMNPGSRLAGRLKLELQDKYTTYNGEFVRRR